MIRIIIIIILFFTLFMYNTFACTTVIVSGKFTTNGRPLLLKHRDSGFYQNKLMYFEDGQFNYIGLVNSVDENGDEVWGGVNSEGFAIINSASYNFKNEDDTTSLKDMEGVVMKKALQSCTTVEDFEKLLIDYPKPMGVEANFGVIDAKGGAAYYETNNFSFVKIDVNDLSVAPHGYIIRTNYSFNGDANEGYGYIRYSTAEQLFYKASSENNLNHKFILQDVSRSLKHSLLEVDYGIDIKNSELNDFYIPLQDFIPRHSSVSTVLIEGVKKDESAHLATLWTILGFQLTSVAIPTWVEARNSIPDILLSDDSGNAPLCKFSLKLKKECFPIERGSGYKYMNLSKVYNKEGNGIRQILKSVEDEILKRTEDNLSIWRNNNNAPIEEIHNLYYWINNTVRKKYKEEFELY